MSEPSILRIATRRSPLALWQAEHVRDELMRLHPGLAVELVALSTRGDKILDTPLAKVGGKGLFVKELELALLEGEADMAVHSMKDVPMELDESFELAAILAREDPRDALVSDGFASLAALPAGCRVGTSSLRRTCQVRAARPDVEVGWLRGNVQTRLKRLDEGRFDAIILAAAGLKRLKLDHRASAWLAPEESLPAVGQGALGIELRAGDERTRALLEPLHDRHTAICVGAERAMNRRLEGGCQVPIAGYALLDGDDLWLRGLVGDPASGELVRAEARGYGDDGVSIGVEVAEALLGQGADRILASVYGGAGA